MLGTPFTAAQLSQYLCFGTSLPKTFVLVKPPAAVYVCSAASSLGHTVAFLRSFTFIALLSSVAFLSSFTFVALLSSVTCLQHAQQGRHSATSPYQQPCGSPRAIPNASRRRLAGACWADPDAPERAYVSIRRHTPAYRKCAGRIGTHLCVRCWGLYIHSSSLYPLPRRRRGGRLAVQVLVITVLV